MGTVSVDADGALPGGIRVGAVGDIGGGVETGVVTGGVIIGDVGINEDDDTAVGGADGGGADANNVDTSDTSVGDFRPMAGRWLGAVGGRFAAESATASGSGLAAGPSLFALRFINSSAPVGHEKEREREREKPQRTICQLEPFAELPLQLIIHRTKEGDKVFVSFDSGTCVKSTHTIVRYSKNVTIVHVRD